MKAVALNLDSLKAQIGKEIAISDWVTISQEDIDLFGKATRDPDPMHVDPKWAGEEGPFGSTILFGFQTLSMLSHLTSVMRESLLTSELPYALNYGLNKVRFIAPVPVNSRIRNRCVLQEVQERPDGNAIFISHNTIEIEGHEQPAMIAEWLGFLPCSEAT